MAYRVLILLICAAAISFALIVIPGAPAPSGPAQALTAALPEARPPTAATDAERSGGTGRSCSARRRKTSAEDALATQRLALSTAHAALVRDLRAAMALDPRYAEYEQCVARAERCASLLSDLIYIALAGLISRTQADVYDVMAIVTRETEPALHAQLADVVATSTDPVERMGALALLDPRYGFEHRELPREAYTGLRERSAAEVQHLLRRHRHVPVTDPQAVEEIFETANDSGADVRIRRAAFHALGHGGTAAQLNALTELPPSQLELRALTNALASCGAACKGSVANLMLSGDPNARLAAYQAAALTRASDRNALVEQVLATSPPAEKLSEAELAEREALLSFETNEAAL